MVRGLLGHAGEHGVGHRYLIQHSAGSGKSNSIARLARQLIDLRKDGAHVFHSIIVVTDRRILDQQIRDTIKQFASTVQKFPLILDDIGNDHRGRGLFGEPNDADGRTKHRPFHSYTMKQAMQERFILDVLAHYTPVQSYYRLVKATAEDPNSTSSAPARSCGGTWRATSTPSASRPRSWWTTSTSRCWPSTRSGARPGP